MGQPKVQDKRKRVIYAMVALAVAAIVLFSLLAAFYYWQAMDYRDAKYKAQYVLVQDILSAIPMADENITDALDDLLDNGWRRSAAMTASALASGISDACHAVQVMYPEDDVKHMTFANLTSAFSALSQGAYEAYIELSSEVGPDEEHDVDADTDAALRTAQDLIVQIAEAIEAGVDPGTDWTQDPYDLLDGMDLAALDGLAVELRQLFE